MNIFGIGRRDFLKTAAALIMAPLSALGSGKTIQAATLTSTATDLEFEQFKQAVVRASINPSFSHDDNEIRLMSAYRNRYNYSPSTLANWLVRIACNTFDNEDENNPYYRINKTAITALKYLGDKNETLNALEKCVRDVPDYFNMRGKIPYVAFHVAISERVGSDTYLRAKRIIERMQNDIIGDAGKDATFVLRNLNSVERKLS